MQRLREIVLVVPLCVAAACAGSNDENVGSQIDPLCGCPTDAGTPPPDATPDAGTPPGTPGCIEFVNPHGQTIPPAGSTTLPGPKGGQNEDGFYKISSTTGADVVVVDQGSGTVFGPYASGTVIKYTQAPGGTPSEKKIGSDQGQAGAVLVHITGTGDAGIRLATGGDVVVCLVPPKPK